MNKLSICTVCMNRIHHLKKTLPVNIAENAGYPDVEFVVLDYNSGDGMEDWAKENLQEHISSGRVKYYKTYEPQYFSVSHSKNLLLKLAAGNILCLVDADNYAGPGYAAWVNTVFGAADNNTIVTTLRKNAIPYRDQGGKICFRKSDFDAVNGFDESFTNYGFEDVDLVNRLELAGGTRYFIEEEKYLGHLSHSHRDRLKNYALINRLEALYMLKTADLGGGNKVLYLFKDNSFMEVQYEYNEQQKDNVMYGFAGWKMVKEGRKTGMFDRVNGTLHLKFEDQPAVTCHETDTGIMNEVKDGQIFWKKIPNSQEIYFTLIMLYGESVNRLKYWQNNDNESGPINADGWGKGIVYLNFDTSRPVTVL